MAQYRYQVTIPRVDGLAENAVSNTFYAAAANDVDAASFASTIEAFYASINGGGPDELGAYYGIAMSRDTDACSIRWYDLIDPEPRVPVGTNFFTLPASNSGTQLPGEVALCLSFQAAPVSGGVQARRRGRVFLGPFNAGVLSYDVGDADARPSDDLIETAIRGAQALMANSVAEWSVHSTLSPVLLAVDSGWVDNAFDTQRRRGAIATARNTFTAVTP